MKFPLRPCLRRGGYACGEQVRVPEHLPPGVVEDAEVGGADDGVFGCGLEAEFDCALVGQTASVAGNSVLLAGSLGETATEAVADVEGVGVDPRIASGVVRCDVPSSFQNSAQGHFSRDWTHGFHRAIASRLVLRSI